MRETASCTSTNLRILANATKQTGDREGEHSLVERVVVNHAGGIPSAEIFHSRKIMSTLVNPPYLRQKSSPSLACSTLSAGLDDRILAHTSSLPSPPPGPFCSNSEKVKRFAPMTLNTFYRANQQGDTMYEPLVQSRCSENYRDVGCCFGGALDKIPSASVTATLDKILSIPSHTRRSRCIIERCSSNWGRSFAASTLLLKCLLDI